MYVKYSLCGPIHFKLFHCLLYISVYSSGVNFNTRGNIALQTFTGPKMDESADGYDRFYVHNDTDQNYIGVSKKSTPYSVRRGGYQDIQRPKYGVYENWHPNF